MESRKFLNLLIGVSFCVFALGFLEWTRDGGSGGLIIGGGEVVGELTAFVLLIRRAEIPSKIGQKSKKYLSLFFLSLAIADASYITLFYFNSYPQTAWWTSILTTYMYAAAFLFAGIALLKSFEETFLKAIAHPLALIPSFFFLPLGIRFMAAPYFKSIIQEQSWSTHSIGQGIVIIVSSFAIFIALLATLTARNIFWSAFSLGIVTLIFGDWALRIDVLSGHQPQFGFYEYFWAVGIFLCSFSIMNLRDLARPIERFDSSSLLSSYKLGTVSLAILFLGFMCFSRDENTQSIRIVSLGATFSIIAATMVSHFLTERVQTFALRLGSALTEVSETKTENNHLANIPLELTQSLKLVFQRRLAEERRNEVRQSELKIAMTRAEMANQVAHDIRSPLATLRVVTARSEQLPAEERGLVESAVERIHEIAKQLLRSNRHALTLENVAKCIPAEVIERMLAEKRALYRFNGNIEIRANFERVDRFENAAIDSNHLAVILSNLIDNAIQSIERTGVICVELCGEENDQFVLKVADNGRGISRDLISIVGRRGMTTKQVDGNGLGLYSAKEILSKVGGHFSIHSTEGAGTTVTLRLPKFFENHGDDFGI